MTDVGGVPLRYLLREIDERGGDALPLLSVSIHSGVGRREEFSQDPHRAETLDNYKRCQAGDVVLNRMRAFQGALGVAPTPGLVSPDYAVLRPAAGVDPRFVAYSLRSHWGLGEMRSRLRGIGGMGAGAVRTPRINVDDLLGIKILAPPFSRQRAVADFLDGECQRIGALAAGFMRLTLAARRAERMHIEPRLIAAGRRYGRVKLGWYAHVLPGYAFPSSGFVTGEQTGTIRLLRGVNLTPGETRWSDVVSWPEARTAGLAAWSLRKDDLVMGMDRPWIKGGLRIATISSSDLPAYLLQRVARIRPYDDRLANGYLRLWLELDLFEHDVSHAMTGVAVPHISGSQIEGFRIAVPPREAQEAAIAEANASRWKTSKLEVAADTVASRLAEYRDALIAEVVTGQLDATTLSDVRMDERARAATEGDTAAVKSLVATAE